MNEKEIEKLQDLIFDLTSTSEEAKKAVDVIDKKMQDISVELEEGKKRFGHLSENQEYLDFIHGITIKQIEVILKTPQPKELHELHKRLVRELHPGLDMRPYKRMELKP